MFHITEASKKCHILLTLLAHTVRVNTTKEKTSNDTGPQKLNATLADQEEREVPHADKTVLALILSHVSCHSAKSHDGLHCSFQQISDPLMEGVLNPSLKPLTPSAPGSERASCLWGASYRAKPLTRRG